MPPSSDHDHIGHPATANITTVAIVPPARPIGADDAPAAHVGQPAAGDDADAGGRRGQQGERRDAGRREAAVLAQEVVLELERGRGEQRRRGSPRWRGATVAGGGSPAADPCAGVRICGSPAAGGRPRRPGRGRPASRRRSSASRGSPVSASGRTHTHIPAPSAPVIVIRLKAYAREPAWHLLGGHDGDQHAERAGRADGARVVSR